MKRNKKLFNNKLAKGLVSLITIITLLSSILAVSIFYQDNITANVIKKSTIENGGFFSNVQIKLVDDIKELSQLNEGWYSIRNGYVYYLEHFDSYVPLWIKVKNMEQQNLLIVVDEDGEISIKKFNEEVVEFFSDKNKEKKSLNQEETVLAEVCNDKNKYINLSVRTKELCRATVAQPGRASALGADVLADVRVQNQNLDGSPGSGALNKNQITGQVTGLEKVSGLATDDRKVTVYIEPIPKELYEKIAKAEERHKLPDKLLFSLINVESHFRPKVEGSSKSTSEKSIGLTQLLLSTAKDLRVNPYDEDQNIDGGAEYLKQQLDYFSSKELALLAYNAGPTRVKSFLEGKSSIPAGSQEYLAKVLLTQEYYKLNPSMREGVTVVYKQPSSITKEIVNTPGWFYSQIKPAASVSNIPPYTETPAQKGLIQKYREGGYSVEGHDQYNNIKLINRFRGKWIIVTPDGHKIETEQAYELYKNSITSGNPSEQAPTSSEKYYTFKITYPDGKERTETIKATSEGEASKELRDAYSPDYNIEPISSQVSKVGLQTTLVGINNKETRVDYNGEYVGTYATDSPELKKITTELRQLDSLRKKNPDLTDDQLWTIYLTTKSFKDENTAKEIAKQLKVEIQPIASVEESKELKQQLPKQVIGIDGKPKKVWTLPDGSITTDQSYVQSIIQQLLAEQAMNKQGLKPLGKVDKNNLPLAKDLQGNVYTSSYDSKTIKYSYEMADDYVAVDKITKEDKTLNIHSSYERENKNTPYKEIETLLFIGEDEDIRQAEINGRLAYIDAATAEQAKDAFNKGLTVSPTGSSKTDTIVEIKERDGRLLRRTTFLKDSIPSKGEGVKIEEKFKRAYFFEGKEITKEEAEKLTKEGKKPQEISDFPTFKIVEERKDNELIYLTTYQFDTKFDDKVRKQVITYEAIKIEQKTGRVMEFIYGKAGKEIIFGPPKYSPFGILTECGEGIGEQTLKDDGCTALKQFASRQFFAEAERVLTEFRGLGYYATLFFDEDSLLKWRDNVDRAFATLYLGTEYWSSALCSVYIDGEDEGIAYAETPQGLAQVGAHIEAVRTEPIITPTGREFIYKITFNVRNGDWDKDPRAPKEMNINVVLKGERTVTVFKQEQKIRRGSLFGRTGRNAIVQDSTVLYTHICLTFDEIPLRWKLDNKELCNIIVESSGEATAISSPAAAATATPSGEAESEINDF